MGPGFIDSSAESVTAQPAPPQSPLVKAQQQSVSLKAEQQTISVLVTARNYGRFLRQCLESIRAQTLKPIDIIYSDDGSEDDSVQIVQQFPDVKILARKFEGVAAARNAAVAVSRGELLVHVDGDDTLPANFLQNHFEALAKRPEVLFAYGPARAFGEHETFWKVPSWDRASLWRRNFVNTSSMYRRWAFEAAGGWRQGENTGWDWDLALRVSRFGPGVPSHQAVLNYRQHPHNWSSRFRNVAETEHFPGKLLGRIRRLAARISICTPLSGRIPGFFPQWLAALAGSIEASGLSKPSLVLLDCSPNGLSSSVFAAVEQHSRMFSEIRYSKRSNTYISTPQREQRNRVAQYMASVCNQLLSIANTDIAWFVDDDIIVPQNAYSDLTQLLTDGLRPRSAVSGLYRSRHDPSRFVAHNWNGAIEPVREPPRQPFEVDMAGTGCLMVLCSVANHRFRSHAHDIPAHDWAWCLDLKQKGSQVIVHPGVQCRHYVDEHQFV